MQTKNFDTDTQSSDKVSRFNTGAISAEILGRVKETLYELRIRGDFVNWKILLDGLYSEVHPKMNKTEQQAAALFRNGIDLCLKEHLKEFEVFKQRAKQKGMIPSKCPLHYEIYDLLDEWQLQIMVYLDKHGMGLPDETGLGANF